VPQCGYCQNGMIIAAVELLARVPDPSVMEIKKAFSEPDPHLCRCGTYPAIIRGVQRAAKAMQQVQ
jgi:aerobic-type carbon monoxide dehydrogenase small subunit (CoxS/CutS family)